MEAEDRLNQTRYFLDRVKENVHDSFAFECNLFAFIVSGRSVTEMLEKEFSKVSGFKDWFDRTWEMMMSDDDFRFFKKERDFVVHRRGLDMAQKIARHISVPLVTSETVRVGKLKSVVKLSPRRDAPPPVVTKSSWWFFEDRPRDDAVALCEQYVVILDDFIRLFNERFR